MIINSPRLIPALFALTFAVTGSIATAQPTYKSPAPADYKVPLADLEKWAARLKKLCPKRGWTIKVENNDILIERDKMVTFRTWPQIAVDPQRDDSTAKLKHPKSEGPYRLRLRFEPLLSQDKYEQLVAENEATKTEQTALLKRHGLSEIQGEFYNHDKAETLQARKQAYFEEARKLSFYRLPNLFCADYSIKLYRSWGQFQRVDDDDDTVAMACASVSRALTCSFGKYQYIDSIGDILSGIEGEELSGPTL